MPFKSAKQAAYLKSKHPDVYDRFVKHSPSKARKAMKDSKRKNRYSEALM